MNFKEKAEEWAKDFEIYWAGAIDFKTPKQLVTEITEALLCAHRAGIKANLDKLYEKRIEGDIERDGYCLITKEDWKKLNKLQDTLSARVSDEVILSAAKALFCRKEDDVVSFNAGARWMEALKAQSLALQATEQGEMK